MNARASLGTCAGAPYLDYLFYQAPALKQSCPTCQGSANWGSNAPQTSLIPEAGLIILTPFNIKRKKLEQLVVDGIIMEWNPGSVALVPYWPYNAGGVLYWPADRPSSALIMTLSVEAPTLGGVRSTIIHVAPRVRERDLKIS